jgi:LemA protein
MLPTLIAISAVGILIAIWITSTRRKLSILEDNTESAMLQIGVQLGSRWDALTILLDLAKSYGDQENERLIGTINLKRIVITINSTPYDVLHQEKIISETLNIIAIIAKQCPGLTTDQTYINNMGAVQAFENMTRTSRLIYNHSVTKLNREIKMFPTRLIAGILGFHQRTYLESI